jgi:hypothetical protein
MAIGTALSFFRRPANSLLGHQKTSKNEENKI